MFGAMSGMHATSESSLVEGCSPVADYSSNRRALVLIVEDEPALQALAGDVAEAAGLGHLAAKNASQAVQLLERHGDIAVILADLNLSGPTDGLAFAEIVRKRWPQIDLLVTSGKRVPLPNRLPDGSTYIAMPFNVAKVVEALQESVDRVLRRRIDAD